MQIVENTMLSHTLRFDQLILSLLNHRIDCAKDGYDSIVYFPWWEYFMNKQCSPAAGGANSSTLLSHLKQGRGSPVTGMN